MNSISKSLSISLIGCGSVGVSLLYQLEKLKDSFSFLTIYLFCKDNTFAQGYAYDTQNEQFLLNAHRHEMSLDPDLPAHFSNWSGIESEKFEKSLGTRAMFGKYLKNSFEQILAKSSAHFKIIFISEEVINCVRKDENSVLTVTNNRSILTDIAIFCHGSRQHEIMSKATSQHSNFINNIYSGIARLKALPENSRILLLGSGLTMVDASLILKENNKQYSIVTASRSGYFPKIISAATVLDKNHIISFIHDLKDLIIFINTNLSARLNREYNILNEIQRYKNDDINAQVFTDRSPAETEIIYSFSLVISVAIENIWSRLNFSEKNVAKKISKYLDRYLSGIPKENIMRIVAFLEAANFKVAKLQNLNSFRKTFQAKLKGCRNYLKFDYVINCTGIEGLYKASNPSALARNILKSNAYDITPEYGLQVDARTCNVLSRKNIIKNIFAVGEAKIGSGNLCCDYAFHVRDVKKVVKAFIVFSQSVKNGKRWHWNRGNLHKF